MKVGQFMFTLFSPQGLRKQNAIKNKQQNHRNAVLNDIIIHMYVHTYIHILMKSYHFIL